MKIIGWGLIMVSIGTFIYFFGDIPSHKPLLAAFLGMVAGAGGSIVASENVFKRSNGKG